METHKEDSGFRVEAPPPGMGMEFPVKPVSVSWFYPFLMILALGCSAASLFLAAFSHWESIKGALG